MSHVAEVEPPRPAEGPDPEERAGLLLRHLGTRVQGLSESEVRRRLEQHGPNEIRRRGGPGHARALLAQFTHPLALLLWVAAVLALIAGIAALAVAIVVVIALNALFAFAQELQAERATEALREFLPPRARVRRDGRVADVDATNLVPGDVMLLSEGDRLSSDARLVEGAVDVDMSPLTGESQPVSRSSVRSRPAPSPSNPMLLWGIGFELLFAAAVIYLPPLQAIFGTAGLGVRELMLLATFPFVVWGSDELRRWVVRRRDTDAPSVRSGASP